MVFGVRLVPAVWQAWLFYTLYVNHMEYGQASLGYWWAVIISATGQVVVKETDDTEPSRNSASIVSSLKTSNMISHTVAHASCMPSPCLVFSNSSYDEGSERNSLAYFCTPSTLTADSECLTWQSNVLYSWIQFYYPTWTKPVSSLHCQVSQDCLAPGLGLACHQGTPSQSISLHAVMMWPESATWTKSPTAFHLCAHHMEWLCSSAGMWAEGWSHLPWLCSFCRATPACQYGLNTIRQITRGESYWSHMTHRSKT